MLIRPDAVVKTTDVVVVGYGLAGAVAAITAHDNGAKTLILEKQPLGHWNNSSASSGLFLNVRDIDGAIHYAEGLYHVSGELYWTDREIIKVWAARMAENRDWVKALGGTFKFIASGGHHSTVPGCDSVEQYQFAGLGVGMMRFFDGEIRERGIDVMYGAGATRLLTASSGEVAGVRVRNSGKEVDIGASRAVILTSGGFEANEEMTLQYIGAEPRYWHCANPALTGDGIKMAMEVGAKLWHMNCCSSPIPASKFVGCPYPIRIAGGKTSVALHNRKLRGEAHLESDAGFVIVDKYGHRFHNEASGLLAGQSFMVFDVKKLEYPRIPSYLIFDQKRMEAGPLPIAHAGTCSALQLYKWSRNNKAELEKGWIIAAGCLRELAGKLGLPPDVLEKTIQTYNQYCQNGTDAEFGRPASTLRPLNDPPFYAVNQILVGANTLGGPKRNARAQIVSTDDEPIPRLYSAGELGSVYAKLYPQAGGSLGECIAFGRIAGENAAKEKANA